MTNPIVIDIETKNTFFDVGRDNFDGLDISMIGLFSYGHNDFFAFDEHKIKEAGEILKTANPIIGFSINRFDIPVLNRHFDFDLFSIPRVDLLDEIEMKTGKRVSLNALAKTNLGVSKTHHSLEAPILYKNGHIEELKNYCLNDVKITKELYELGKSQGYLLVPQKDTGEIEKIEIALGLV